MSEALDLRNATNDAYSVPLDKIEIGNPDRFRDNTIWPYFARLRKEDPVHYTPESVWGPFWSITTFEDIMFVDTHHDLFSSEGGITIDNEDVEFELPMFIAMDPPKHDMQRKTVSGVVAPPNLAKMESTIRERAGLILDSAAEERDVQLGRQSVDRADHADARDAVRLPVGRPPQADVLERPDHRRRNVGTSTNPKMTAAPNC